MPPSAWAIPTPTTDASSRAPLPMSAAPSLPCGASDTSYAAAAGVPIPRGPESDIPPSYTCAGTRQRGPGSRIVPRVELCRERPCRSARRPGHYRRRDKGGRSGGHGPPVRPPSKGRKPPKQAVYRGVSPSASLWGPSSLSWLLPTRAQVPGNGGRGRESPRTGLDRERPRPFRDHWLGHQVATSGANKGGRSGVMAPPVRPPSKGRKPPKQAVCRGVPPSASLWGP